LTKNRRLRSNLTVYDEDSDFIRGHRLTNAESWALLVQDVPEMSADVEAIIEAFASVDCGQRIEITPEMLEKINDLNK
jgi:ribosomal protein L16 Arg81 hydroxylase